MKWLDRTVMRGTYLTLCTSQKEFDRILKHLGTPKDVWLKDNVGACMHTYGNKGKITCVVCIPLSLHNPIEVAALLVHEGTHVKQAMMRFIGESSPSEEFEAYAMQNICQELFTEYARRLKA
jgi:hypothetical protein